MATTTPVRTARTHPRSVEVLRFAPCPVCHCRKRVLDEEDGVQTLRCLECGVEMRMTGISQRVHVPLVGARH